MALNRNSRLPGPRYLIAHACFDCRKSFKRSPRPDCAALCPHCGGSAHEMGRSFKTPAGDDIEQWNKVQALFAAGFRFFGYRSTLGPPLPARLTDVQSFLIENPAHPLRIASPIDFLKPKLGQHTSKASP